MSHWMWYIFPQISGLGHSSLATYYAISDLDEARAYLSDIVLGNRLKEISNELLKLDTNTPTLVFGAVDSLKLNSSMTLFDYVSDSSIFSEVIDKYYDGKKDELTIAICDKITTDYSKEFNIPLHRTPLFLQIQLFHLCCRLAGILHSNAVLGMGVRQVQHKHVDPF